MIHFSSAPEKHIPVMLQEVLEAMHVADGKVFIDATFGAGGYARALLDHANCTVYGFDRDPRAIAAGREWVDHYKGRLTLIEEPFSKMEEALNSMGVTRIDGIVFDLGVSSMQLDEGARGFSFRLDGPLSMRMDGGKPDVADIINVASYEDLKLIFRVFGEEKRAASIARTIVKAREMSPITTTRHLAELVETANPQIFSKKKGKSIHPATRIFQALRIFINDELGQLAKGLVAAERLLCAGGHLVVVTFHSLEARIVKRFLTERSGQVAKGSRHQPDMDRPEATFNVLYRGQIGPSETEIANNPRARSAAMRVGVRTAIPMSGGGVSFAGLPALQFSKSISLMEII